MLSSASLQQRIRRMQAKSLTVVAIDAGETDRAVQRFFATLPVPFPILLDRDRAIARSVPLMCCRPRSCSTAIAFRASSPTATLLSRPDVEQALTSLFALRSRRTPSHVGLCAIWI